MKYKEVFYTGTYYTFYKRHKGIKVRFRYDPVPGTGGYKSFAKIYRNPKTNQERKYACDPEHKPYIRGKRSLKILPDPWDDILVSKVKRNWKRTKKRKQWM